jgi:putative ABC transport system permease protein
LKFWRIKIDPAAMKAFHARANAAIVGVRLMRSYNWKVGQTVTLGTLNNNAFVIAGVFSADGSALETRALAGRSFLQDALDSRGICNNIMILVDDARHADEVIRFIDEEMSFPKKTHTKREKAFLATIAEEMSNMLSFSRWIVLSTLLVILMGVANTVSMSMRDRVQEIGVLRTLGFRRLTIAGIVLSESVLVSLAGGVLAIPTVLGGLALFNALVGVIHIRGVGVAVDIEPGLLLLSLPVAATAGVLGGILPALFASRKKIVDCFRAID